MENPWDIKSVLDLLVFKCPACVYLDASKQSFVNHACYDHPESLTYLKKICDDSLDDVEIPVIPEIEIKTEIIEDHPQNEKVKETTSKLDTQYNCGVCLQNFENSESLLQHFQTVHEKSEEMVVDYDDHYSEYFESEIDEEFEEDITRKTRKKPKSKYAECPICFKIQLQKNLKRHLLTIHNSDKPLKEYEIIQKTESDKPPKKVKKPVPIRPKIDPLQLDTKMEEIIVNENIDIEQIGLTESEELYCDKCGMSFETLEEKMEHKHNKNKKSKYAECPICFKTQLEKNLKRHIATLHDPNKPVKLTKPSVEPKIKKVSDKEKVEKSSTTYEKYELECQESLFQHFQTVHEKSEEMDVDYDNHSEYFESEEFEEDLTYTNVKKKKPKSKYAECPICFKTQLEKNLKRHIATLHDPNKPVKLTKPSVESKPKKSKTISKEKKIEKSCNTYEKYELECQECNQKFKNYYRISKHVRKAHEINSNTETFDIKPENSSDNPDLKCDKCHESFSDILKLEKHKRIHHGTLCALCFQTAPNLVDHMIKDHQRLELSCLSCQIFFDNIKDLTQHAEKCGQSYKCPLCSDNFKTYKHLKSHLKQVHWGSSVVCHICGESKADEKILKQHIERVHENTSKYECDQCGKFFKNKGYVQAHKQWVHEGKKKFQCDQCGLKAYTRPELRVHIENVHEGQRNHQCSECGKRVSTVTGLALHIERMHKDVRRYPCDQCDRSFHLKSHLNRHIQNQHQGVRDHKCDQCGRGFFERYALDKHVKIVHLGVRDFKCDFCGKCFTRNEYLRKHQETCHHKSLVSLAST